ncbi:MAG: kinase [Rhodobacteraceae bacterium]|nr:kinase [Paracoccaceae bacterium]
MTSLAQPDILCIGALLWDVIGRGPAAMAAGDDMPGRITRRPGGVALNVATALARHGLRPALLGAVGQDPEGDALIACCAAIGLETAYLHRSATHPTDIYMAIESGQTVLAAIADAAGLEAAGAAILTPLTEGPLGTAQAPFGGTVVLDGNLTDAGLAAIATDPCFAAADLRVAPASPGKATRIAPLLCHPRATIYVNRAEAGLLAGQGFADAPQAAAALLGRGARRVLVTDGADAAALAGPDGVIVRRPAPVQVAHVTGAGDALMAAHIAAERAGAAPGAALEAALGGAARHVAAGPAA